MLHQGRNSRMYPFLFTLPTFCFSISFGQEVYPRKMRDKVRQQQLQMQMAQLYASEQVRISCRKSLQHSCTISLRRALDVLL